jgi:hypothetical protein
MLPRQCPPTSVPAQLTSSNIDAVAAYDYPVDTHQRRRHCCLQNTQLTPTNVDFVAAYKCSVDIHQH